VKSDVIASKKMNDELGECTLKHNSRLEELQRIIAKQGLELFIVSNEESIQHPIPDGYLVQAVGRSIPYSDLQWRSCQSCLFRGFMV
jgi:hypothetical protein